MSRANEAKEDDRNTHLGLHVDDLSKDTPPDTFLFPRTFLDMHLLHDKVGVYPFLPAYPPQLLQWLQPNPITESCAGKFCLSAAMGTYVCLVSVTIYDISSSRVPMHWDLSFLFLVFVSK